MSLAENYKRNQFTTPWTTAAKARLIELWPTDLTIEQIAHKLLIEHGHLWSGQSISWKAEHLRLPARKHPSVWTEEMAVIVRERWTNGASVISIADLLFQSTGIKFSRNAIIGKAHRLGLEKHQNANRVFLDPARRAEHRKNYNKNWVTTHRQRVNELARINARRRKERETAPTIEDF